MKLEQVAATRLSGLLAEHEVPIVLRMASEGGLSVLVRGEQVKGVRAVCLAEVLASPPLVLDTTREALAQVIHAQYVRGELARGATPAANPALVPWHHLPEDLKQSNREQAGHIPVKLRALGCSLVPLVEEVPPIVLTGEEVERLARLEHARWCDERCGSGWRFGPVKDPARRLHPSLVPWERLNEADRERDRAAVRLLPTLVARAGYAIVRPAP